MRRVVIVGISGSGKTTLARVVAARLDVPHVELDAHHHQPGWVPLPAPQFAEAVNRALDEADATAHGWVVCGNYAAVQAGIWARADSIVWLDLPRGVVMWRISRRSLGRAVRGTALWNGNRERLGDVLALHDPQRSMIRWSWDGVEGCRLRYAEAMTGATWGGLRWHRLRSRRAVRDWVLALAGA